MANPEVCAKLTTYKSCNEPFCEFLKTNRRWILFFSKVATKGGIFIFPGLAKFSEWLPLDYSF